MLPFVLPVAFASFLQAAINALIQSSAPFILGLFMSILGEGTIAQGITGDLSPTHGKAVIQYLIDHPETYMHCSHISDDECTNNTGRKIK